VKDFQHQRAGSSSSSQYSSDSFNDHSTTHKGKRTDVSPTAIRQRSSIPLEGGSVRRRVAPVHLDMTREPRTIVSPGSASTPSPKSNVALPSPNLRSRRGIQPCLDDLALVTPSKPSSAAHSYMTPPSTAPAFGDKSSVAQSRSRSQEASFSSHHRSASETVGLNKRIHVPRKSSRDIGIIGTSLQDSMTIEPPKEFLSPKKQKIQPPIFQIPQSRSPSPDKKLNVEEPQTIPHHSHYPANDAPPVQRSSGTEQLNAPPEIGSASYELGTASAPVVASLGKESSLPFSASSFNENVPLQMSTAPFSPANPSSYLYYQPGLHAIAGPLPPPPKTTILVDPASPPPPRPPRLTSPRPAARARLERSSPTMSVSNGDVVKPTENMSISTSGGSRPSSPGTSSRISRNSQERLPEYAFLSLPYVENAKYRPDRP
jgi:hypothetical protein